MPRPPPPADALSRKGNPISAAIRRASSMEVTSDRLPGITGTPASSIQRRAADLSPILRNAATGGPIKVIPQDAHNSAKSAFSAKGP